MPLLTWPGGNRLVVTAVEVAKSFHVMSLPTILVVKAGEEVIRLDGLIKDQDLRTAFDKALA